MLKQVNARALFPVGASLHCSVLWPGVGLADENHPALSIADASALGHKRCLAEPTISLRNDARGARS